MTTDEAIQRKFRFTGRNRNLPWYPKWGRREELVDLFAELGFKQGVEVGTRKGDFAKCLITRIPNLHLTCVDPWMAYDGSTQERMDGYYKLALENLKGLKITIIRKPSLEVVDKVKDEILDFVYIDGDHSFDMAVRDIIHWSKKVRKGGIIAAHDYHPFVGADVIKAIDAYTHCHKIEPWYVTREIYPTAFWAKK